MYIKEEDNCRVCGGSLTVVLDLGEIYPSTFLSDNEKISEDLKAPLVLAECNNCKLIQLKHTVDLDLMYKKQYWYLSALNKSMISSLKDIVCEIEDRIDIQDDDVIVDIGANDGTMLNMYDKGITVGFDPAPNLKNELNLFVNDYFSAEKYPSNLRKAKVITAIAMFYDLPDPNQFVEDVKLILSDDGIFVVQFTDLLSMFRVCAFDNICFEHLEYYKLSDVMDILRKHGLDVIDVSYNDVNGGSLRVTACLDGAYLPKPSVVSFLAKEKEYLREHGFDYFYKRIVDTLLQCKNFFAECKDFNKKVALLGASTKGNTLLQVCGITNKDAEFAADANKDKFGLRTVGSNIKIIPEDEVLAMKPDFLFVPIWHFKTNLLSKDRIKDYINSGGKLVFPLPEFHIVGKEDLDGSI